MGKYVWISLGVIVGFLGCYFFVSGEKTLSTPEGMQKSVERLELDMALVRTNQVNNNLLINGNAGRLNIAEKWRGEIEIAIKGNNNYFQGEIKKINDELAAVKKGAKKEEEDVKAEEEG